MQKCSVVGCEDKHHALGMCRIHWTRQRLYGRTYKTRGIPKPICSVEDCGVISRSKGFCNNHYQRQYKFGRLHKIHTGEKSNNSLYKSWWEKKNAGVLADEWHDFSRFIKDVGERPSPKHVMLRPKNEPYGPYNFEWYEQLKKNPGETNKQFNARQWASRRQRFPFYEEDRYLKRKYGITSEDYKRILSSQNGGCDICKKEETQYDVRTGSTKKLAVDHCHKTGKVRSLLCSRCNTVIGQIEESTKLLKALSDYVIKHQQEF